FRSHSDTLSYDNRKIFEMNKEWTIVCKDTTIKRYRVEDIKHICQQDYFELKEYKVDTTLQNEEYVQSYYVRNAEDLDCAFEYDMETNQESLLYDLGMKIGTRLDFNGLIFWVVNSKIEYIDTTNMIFLSTDAPTYHIYWKRNIGSLGDLMHPDIPTTDSLLCVKIGDEVIYSRGPIKGISCNGVKDDIQQISAAERIEIIDNRLKINEDAKVIKVSLYNLQGKQVLSTTQTSIDISQFITGVYLVVVQADSAIYSKKIVVK
ncbi:MAG: T9SS type A sorting domain-containing protein, partial [Paludibacteraceae bacterium]|nr:T9SS type A sorting domain-containing protein [Paludibacteraceae bacterium]